MNDRKKTIDAMKERREVPSRLREEVKDFNRVKKLILEAVRSKPGTIPEIAEATGLPLDSVVYHLMTLMKFGHIEADRLDDMDEYYLYKAPEDGK